MVRNWFRFKIMSYGYKRYGKVMLILDLVLDFLMKLLVVEFLLGFDRRFVINYRVVFLWFELGLLELNVRVSIG